MKLIIFCFDTNDADYVHTILRDKDQEYMTEYSLSHYDSRYEYWEEYDDFPLTKEEREFMNNDIMAYSDYGARLNWIEIYDYTKVEKII